jgi:hypothetical protein
MMDKILIYISSIIITIWGIAHIIPTKNIVRGFGEITKDNKLIITMEWISEGILMIFIGLLNLFITLFGNSQSQEARIVLLFSIFFLIMMSILSLFTGARTNIIPMKICPAVKAGCALLIILSLII